MLFPPSRYWIFLFFISLSLALGCVGKGKYYDALQEKAAAQSELGIAEIDLSDARLELSRLDVLEESLRNKIKQLDEVINELSDQSKRDQRQIGASLNKTASEVVAYKQQLNAANQKLAILLDFHAQRSRRLSEISQRLNIALATLPASQMSSTRNYESLKLSFSEELFFLGKGNELSDFGIGSIQMLTGALSNQNDLLIEVVAYPVVSAGTIMSWSSASDRANLIASELVGEYGLSPKQVSATSRQGEIIIIDGAPAESKQRKTIELVIRLDPARYPLPDVD